MTLALSGILNISDILTSTPLWFTLISGGALVMLGALDLVFALQSRKRGVKEGDIGLSVVVLVGGIVAVIYGLLNF